MGTRSLTVVKDEWSGKEIMLMYRQFDGYPEGHGKDLSDYLLGKKIVNGISINDNWNNAFNGMSCLAASVVSHFKDNIGEIYLYPGGERGFGEDYVYIISKMRSSEINIEVEQYGSVIFNGSPGELLEWIARAYKDNV